MPWFVHHFHHKSVFDRFLAACTHTHSPILTSILPAACLPCKQITKKRCQIEFLLSLSPSLKERHLRMLAIVSTWTENEKIENERRTVHKTS